ncbi:hypothetical protein [Rhizobium sp. AG855]|uniref:hypothetical protein n=1 Tax=Rhizobium sp. AG855 TaxID=2183898 RepID=UPI0011C3B351|nr:hypothetical protein [Rhizobium sp. AG855]
MKKVEPGKGRVKEIGVRKAHGEYADVRLVGEALEEFDALEPKTDEKSVRKHRTVSRYFQRFADLGPKSLDDRMFKSQSRMKSSGTEVMIHEFKAHQFRIYGVVCEYDGRRCFIGTACDPEKKQDKADPKKLQKAADEYVRIMK